MRLPFLQVSQEEMARARTLAGYLGVPYPYALGMVVALKAAALEAAPDGDVSGTIRDPNPAEWMAVQCSWPIDRADALATALVRCGFAMAGPSGCHAVAGMEPYARALDTSGKRSEAGRKGAEARKMKGGYGRAMAGPQQNDGPSMARDAKTQTQTQTQIKEETTSAAADASSEQMPLVDVGTSATPAAKPSGRARSNACGEFIDWARAETRKHLLPDAPDNCRLERHQGARLGEAVKLHGIESCKAAFRLWMGWAVAQEKGYPLGLFAARWETWVGQAKAPAVNAPKPARNEKQTTPFSEVEKLWRRTA